LQKALAADESGSVALSWFNQIYLANVFKNITDEEFLLYGKVKTRGSKFEFYPQTFEKVKEGAQTHLGRIVPEYQLTSGVSKKWFRSRIKYLVEQLENENILIPEVGFSPSISSYIKEVHYPSSDKALESAIKVLGTLELAALHLHFLVDKKKNQKSKPASIPVKKATRKMSMLIKKLPFTLTKDQQTIINNLLSKLHEDELLNELIQGDVGTGKTIIALLLSYVFALAGKQTVLLAPTTILAKQHWQTYSEVLEGEQLKIVLVTSDTNTNSIADADILIGTTAVLVRKDSLIQNLGLLIVDEQHRFGVRQREELLEK
jgi:ATP-dependent DNA helicase RecG